MNRRSILLGLGSALSSISTLAVANTDSSVRPVIQIALSPTCGCCKEWVAHLRQNGFETRSKRCRRSTDGRWRRASRPNSGHVTPHSWAAIFIEGHVPVDDIRRLLAERPNARGLAVPGMPVGSPGMEVPNVAPDNTRRCLSASIIEPPCGLSIENAAVPHQVLLCNKM